MSIVPDEPAPTFRCIRTPQSNPQVHPETLVRLLWRNEVKVALSSLGEDVDSRDSRSTLWQRLLDLVSVDSLKEVVRLTLLGRDRRLARIPTRRFSGAGHLAVDLLCNDSEVV
jgi:hypothetical protein